MKIAVVGGGAAGVAATYLLAPHHEVTLYERAPILGGHIRTVGRNVPCDAVDPVRPLEAGVIEFDRASFHRFRALMADLDVELRGVDIFTSLYGSGLRLHSLGLLRSCGWSRWHKARALARLLPLAWPKRRFEARGRAAVATVLREQTMADWLPPGPLTPWMRALLTYAYSAPFGETRDFPAELGVPVLLHFMCDRLDWAVIPGGVYTWIERAIERAAAHGAEVRLATPVEAIHRRPDGVTIDADDARAFDAVVIATSPGQIPRLLADADADERRRFGAWQDHDFHTLVHDDRAFLDARGVTDPTAFDLFVDGARGGYNALLNHLCGYPKYAPRRFGLALDLDHLIDPARVLHRQPHTAPLYTLDAFRHRAEVQAHNGHRHTWIAGAWLGDGLHEGAIGSAVDVSAALGGRVPIPAP